MDRGHLMTTTSKKFPIYHLLQRLAKINASSVKIGILAADFKTEKTGDDEGDSTTLGEIALIHEFGTDQIPQRSFIRSTFHEKRKEWRAFAKQQIELAMKGQLTEKQVLERLGLRIQADIKNRIVAGIGPPLSPITIQLRLQKRGKASTTPLIDTGQLLNSINYEVTIK